MMLQILDEGRLTDSKGRKVSFKNTIIIMTSNVGARAIENDRQFGFAAPTDTQAEEERRYRLMQNRLMDEMKRTFRPEFLNRVDEIIVFHRLNMEHLGKIFDMLVSNLKQRLSEKEVKIEISQAAKDYLCEQSQVSDRPGVGISSADGGDKISKDGARPLLRVIQRELENALAEKLLQKEFLPGDTVEVDYDEESKQLKFTKGELHNMSKHELEQEIGAH
jgi:ATP-dependent Clp protease ATP-binding subunit ClpC